MGGFLTPYLPASTSGGPPTTFVGAHTRQTHRRIQSRIESRVN